MDQARRELLAARVISGVTRLRVHDGCGRELTVVHRPPSREQRYAAQELYQDTLREAELDGSYTEEEFVPFLRHQGLWDDEREALLKKFEKDIDDFKAKMFEFLHRSNERRRVRRHLEEAKRRREELYAERHSHDHLSAAGAAAMARTRYVVGCSLFYPSGRLVLPPEAFYSGGRVEWASAVFDNAVEAFLSSRLDDACLRELARTEPWRSVWGASKRAGSAFGVPSADLTEEQLRLQVWSQMYEGAESHPERPPDAAFEDDDLFDGWLIVQRRKRGTDRAGRGEVANQKIADSQEVYIVADTAEDAADVEALNDEAALRTKRKRQELIRRLGEVNEVDMPDTRLRLQMELAALRGPALGGGK